MESSSRSPVMESSSRSPVMESRSRSPVMESSSRSPVMESSSRSPVMESRSRLADSDSLAASSKNIAPLNLNLEMNDNHVLTSENVHESIIRSIDSKDVPNENRVCNNFNNFIADTDDTSVSHDYSSS